MPSGRFFILGNGIISLQGGLKLEVVGNMVWALDARR